MYLFMSICNKTESKCNLRGINLNVILKRNLTKLPTPVAAQSKA
jgi:hypothetical protein